LLRFEVFTAVTMKNAVLWDVTQCGSCMNRRFGGTATCSSWFLACGFFNPKDGGDTFLRNVGSHKIHTAPHPRRRHSPRNSRLKWMEGKVRREKGGGLGERKINEEGQKDESSRTTPKLCLRVGHYQTVTRILQESAPVWRRGRIPPP
jgi:hypothetical protein